LKANKVPPQFNAKMVIGAMKGGQLTPKAMIDRMKQMGGGGAAAGKGNESGAREREVLAWVDANAPGAFAPWTPVTLPDGTTGEWLVRARPGARVVVDVTTDHAGRDQKTTTVGKEA